MNVQHSIVDIVFNNTKTYIIYSNYLFSLRYVKQIEDIKMHITLLF